MEQPPYTKFEVVAFTSGHSRDETDSADRAGDAIIALVRQAASISSQKLEQTMTLAHKLSMQLRAAEERIVELQSDVERLESRAMRAEQWLQTIKQEIEASLLGPINRPELPGSH